MKNFIISANLLIFFAIVNAAVPISKKWDAKPTFLSQSEYALVKQYYYNMDNKPYETFLNARKELKDPASRALVSYLIGSEYLSDFSKSEIDNFLEEFKDWPKINNIQISVEKKIHYWSRQEILNFYKNREPIDLEAMYLYAKILSQFNDPKAEEFYNQYFLRKNMRMKEIGSFIKKNRKHLFNETIDKKIIALVSSKNHGSAMYLGKLTGGKHLRFAELLISIKKNELNKINLFLKQTDKFESFTDQYALYLIIDMLRKDKRDNEAIILLRNLSAKISLITENQDDWFRLQRLLFLTQVKEKEFATAFFVMDTLNFKSNIYQSEKLFFLGWLSLRFKHDFKYAYENFSNFIDVVSTPISLSRGYYWLGRTLEVDPKLSKNNKEYYYKKAAEYKYSFYGILAAEKLDKYPTLNIENDSFRNYKINKASSTMLEAFDILYHMGKISLAESLGYAIIKTELKEREIPIIGDFFVERGFEYLTIRLMKKYQRDNMFFANYSYPTIPIIESAKKFTEPEFIYAIIRQESEFKSQVISSSNANGLMQLKTSTAKYTAKRYGIKFHKDNLNQNKDFNILLGAAHIDLLMDRFNNNIIYTIAGYNAGPHRVDQWVGNYGRINIDTDPIDWIEMIPFSETRNYVQRVLENRQIYKAINNPYKKAPISLSKDISING